MFKFISLLLAFISIVYEFTLAQTISLFHGSTFIIYAVTIGIYTFSLGFGALFYEKLKGKDATETLLWNELALSVVATLSPLIIVLFSTGGARGFIGSFIYLAVFAPILFCGFLSGIELPALLNINNEQKEGILAWDYAGMFLGSIFFGLYAIEFFGAIQLIWIMSSLNCLAAFSISLQKKIPFQKALNISLGGIFCLNLIFVLNENLLYAFFRSIHGF